MLDSLPPVPVSHCVARERTVRGGPAGQQPPPHFRGPFVERGGMAEDQTLEEARDIIPGGCVGILLRGAEERNRVAIH